MMKKILAAIIIVVLVVVGIPYLLGIQAQRLYEQSVSAIANNTALPFESVSYERGIFSSRAEIECVIGKITLKIYYKILHGPILLDTSKTKPNGLHFGLAWIRNSFSIEPEDSEYAKILSKIRETLGGQELISMKSLVKFNGGIENFFYSPSLEHTTEGGIAIAWQGMNGQISNDRQYRDFKGFLKAPGLKLQAPNWGTGFKTFDENFHSTRVEYNLWTGEDTYSVEEAEMNIPSEQYRVHQLNLNFLAKLEDALYQLGMNVNLKQLEAPQGQYGPFVLAMKIINLDPEGFSLLQDWLQKPSSAFPEGRQQALDLVLQKLFPKTPTLVIENTKLSFPEGELSVDLKISMGGPSSSAVTPTPIPAPIPTAPTETPSSPPSSVLNPVSPSPLPSTTAPNSIETSAYMDKLNGYVHVVIAPALLQKFLAMGMEEGVYAKPEVQNLAPEQKKEALTKEVALKIEKLKSSGLLTEKDTNFELKFELEKGKVMANGKEIDASAL